MPDQWVYSEGPERHPRTQFVPWIPRRYSQTDHLAQMNRQSQDLHPPPGGPEPTFRPVVQPQYPRRQNPPVAYSQEPDIRQPGRPARNSQPQQFAPQAWRKTGLTAVEQFWYVLMCISFGAGYLAKLPVKKALSDFGLAEMTDAEKFWYVLMCIPFGAAYLVKVPAAKAIEQMQRRR
jgi:hypothetical protein